MYQGMRFASLAAAVLLLGACAPGQATEPEASGKAPAGLLDSQKFKVCTDVEFPPMEFFKEGSKDPIGFDVDSARAVAGKWGVTPEFQNMGFDGLMPALQAKRCDAVWSGMYVNDDRLKVADAVEYFATSYGVLSLKGNPTGIRVVDDLSGKRVAVAAGTDVFSYLQDLNKKFAADGKAEMQLSPYPKFTEEVAAVKSGKADVAIEVDLAIADAAHNNPDSFEYLGGVFQEKHSLGIYVAKGSPLKGPLEESWKSLASDGSIATIAKNYGLLPENVVTK